MILSLIVQRFVDLTALVSMVAGDLSLHGDLHHTAL